MHFRSLLAARLQLREIAGLGLICTLPDGVVSEGCFVRSLLPVDHSRACAGLRGQDARQGLLVADTTAIVPGKAFEVGVLLEMAPGWHTYWEYPGDAGLPTSIIWTFPTDS